jgi:hypothetical protein
MSRIDSLPPDQRAVLSLILEKGRGYAQIAALLRLDEGVVRERAHAALDAIGPRDGTPPPAPRRAEIGDYLLGQQTDAEAERTRQYLADSAAGRGWGRVLAGELRGLVNGELPEIPAATGGSAPATVVTSTPAPAPEPPTPEGASQPQISRRGGAILLGALAAVAAVVVLVVLLTSSGGSGHKKATASTGTTSTSAAQTRVLAQINLVPPNHARSPLGVATIIQQGTTEGIALQVTGLAPTTSRMAYGVWLYNSHSSAERIGFAPPVTKNGRLGAIAPVPTNLAQYRAIIITRETNAQGTTPGAIVLAGALPGHTLKP